MKATSESPVSVFSHFLSECVVSDFSLEGMSLISILVESQSVTFLLLPFLPVQKSLHLFLRFPCSVCTICRISVWFPFYRYAHTSPRIARTFRTSLLGIFSVSNPVIQLLFFSWQLTSCFDRKLLIAGPLCSTRVTSLQCYYRPIRHPLVFDTFPTSSGYSIYLAPQHFC